MPCSCLFCVIILITFSAAFYAGIYVAQNYEVPRVDEPSKLLERLKEFANEHKKDK
ncbi:uncharacterized protein LOC113372856 [Ctenocephalides felis]|uniref:uncharacterized protein LOC113372856 n=1 Tax=Ctenocephalides felis TaxID=7515 RepID=UPI000E6E1C9E|nr:uncharacterized protein LOC113372856 [Ctenocephalides felis]